jgi:hypothetical protein
MRLQYLQPVTVYQDNAIKRFWSKMGHNLIVWIRTFGYMVPSILTRLGESLASAFESVRLSAKTKD